MRKNISKPFLLLIIGETAVEDEEKDLKSRAFSAREKCGIAVRGFHQCFFILCAHGMSKNQELSLIWLKLGFPIVGRTREREFRAHFGLGTLATSALWSQIRPFLYQPYIDCHFSANHLLWVLWWLKTPPSSWDQAQSKLKHDKDTIEKRIWAGLKCIYYALPEVRFMQSLFGRVLAHPSIRHRR